MVARISVVPPESTLCPVPEPPALLLAHRDRLQVVLAAGSSVEPALSATVYIAWLDSARSDALALVTQRSGRCHHVEGMGAVRIANAPGLHRVRGQ